MNGDLSIRMIRYATGISMEKSMSPIKLIVLILRDVCEKILFIVNIRKNIKSSILIPK